jgi:protease PrsW
MAVLDSPWFWTAVVVSLIAPLTYLFLLRRVEKYGRESWSAVLGAFLVGAAIAFPAAFLVERIFVRGSGLDEARTINLLVLAPALEESVKALCVLFFWKKLTEPADGVVYGAGVGFGFAAVENMGYALKTAIDTNGWNALLLVVDRLVTASVVHAMLTGVVGLSWAARRARHASVVWIPLALVLAIGLHAGYNLLSTAIVGGDLPTILGVGIAIGFWALVPAGLYGVRRMDGRMRRRRPVGSRAVRRRTF